ncbi:unnamed protein product, partial [Medioppia subpectinata]
MASKGSVSGDSVDIDDDNDGDYDIDYSSADDEPDVNLENQYFNAKAIKDDDPNGALDCFERVIAMEATDETADGKPGDWGFKALKQMMKIYFKLGNYTEMMARYKQLMTYIKTTINKNYSEKSINAILDYISTSKQMELLEQFYETTLEALKDAKNERLFFKTNTKLGKLYFERREFNKLSAVVKRLRELCQTDAGTDDPKKGTHLLEIYAL